MPRKSSLLKFNKLIEEIPMDGCGSQCQDCVATRICKGCNQCHLFNNCPPAGCKSCSARCWRREDIKQWLLDAKGLSIDSCSCPTVFTAELPGYIPQIMSNAYFAEHPAFAINIHRLVQTKHKTWCYRKQGIKHHFKIPESSMALLSFCTKDELLEEMWTRSENWHREESVWDALKDYASDNRGDRQGFEGSMSIEFSCFADFPRMEHHINIKRNLISAHELSHRGLPIIIDAAHKTQEDLIRVLEWGTKNKIKWYVLNYQRTRDVPWLEKMLKQKIKTILQYDGKVILSGIASPRLVANLMKDFQGHLAITNTVVSMKTNYYKEFTGTSWQPSNKKHRELMQYNLKQYQLACGIK